MGIIPFEPLAEQEVLSSSKSFITANTVDIDFSDIRNSHIIPVFLKDNEPLISQADFIETTADIVHHVFKNERILSPAVRVSHPIKGRIPEAKNKPADQLLEEEKTIYYERMAFAIEIPSIADNIEGSPLVLTVGGVKSYQYDNLYARKGSDEHFKIFIGFENKICTNMCIATDGMVANLKVRSANELTDGILKLIESYNAKQHLDDMLEFSRYFIDEKQFAHLLGKCRMYNYLSLADKKDIPMLLFNDTQLNIVARDYYRDSSFSRDYLGNLNLWNLYNLFTGANKTSYIDSFIDRGHNAFQFISTACNSLKTGRSNWFLNGH